MSIQYREIPYDEYRRESKKVHDAIFSGRQPEDRPFRDPAWEMFLFPYGLHMEDNVFAALASAGKQEGDREVFIKDAELISPELTVLALAWDRETLEQVRCLVPYVSVSLHLFGWSGRWGLARDEEDDFICVGGVAGFMNTVAAALGGRETIKSRFLRYAEEEWGALKEFQEKALQSIGWHVR